MKMPDILTGTLLFLCGNNGQISLITSTKDAALVDGLVGLFAGFLK